MLFSESTRYVAVSLQHANAQANRSVAQLSAVPSGHLVKGQDQVGVGHMHSDWSGGVPLAKMKPPSIMMSSEKPAPTDPATT